VSLASRPVCLGYVIHHCTITRRQLCRRAVDRGGPHAAPATKIRRKNLLQLSQNRSVLRPRGLSPQTGASLVGADEPENLYIDDVPNESLQATTTLSLARNCAVGGADRDRTDDLRLAKPALSQLSYSPEELGCLQRAHPDVEPRARKPSSSSGAPVLHLPQPAEAPATRGLGRPRLLENSAR
jgi:hypothetical protein